MCEMIQDNPSTEQNQTSQWQAAPSNSKLLAQWSYSVVIDWFHWLQVQYIFLKTIIALSFMCIYYHVF